MGAHSTRKRTAFMPQSMRLRWKSAGPWKPNHGGAFAPPDTFAPRRMTARPCASRMNPARTDHVGSDTGAGATVVPASEHPTRVPTHASSKASELLISHSRQRRGGGRQNRRRRELAELDDALRLAQHDEGGALAD